MLSKEIEIEHCHHLGLCPLIDHRREPIRVLELLGLLYKKQIDSMLPWVCSVIDHRRCQNVVRTSLIHSPNCLWAIFLFLPDFVVFCDQLLNRHMATSNLFVKWCSWRFSSNGQGLEFLALWVLSNFLSAFITQQMYTNHGQIVFAVTFILFYQILVSPKLQFALAVSHYIDIAFFSRPR